MIMRPSTDWLHDSRWGLFFHYLASPASSLETAALDVDAWNRRVESFDAARFAAQVAEIGARYIFFTIGQNSGFYCAPNATYEATTGVAPGKCSRRDLIADIASALKPYDIRLLVYLPCNAPTKDEAAAVRLRYTPPWDASASGGFRCELCDPNTDERLTEFQLNWEAIVREWSLRWGETVSGWWIDGCIFADKMYRHPDAPNFESFAAALRSGNPSSLLAFNPGWVESTPERRLIAMTPHEDFTAGEVDSMFPICKGRWVEVAGKAVQWHALTYAGEYWGRGEPRFPNAFVQGYTAHVNSKGGVVTWDIPVSPEGCIPRNFVEQMQRMAKGQNGSLVSGPLPAGN